MRGSVADFGRGLPVARLADVQDRDNGDPHGNRDEQGPRGKFDRVPHGCFIRALAGSFLELLLPRRQAPDIPAMWRRISCLRLNPKSDGRARRQVPATNAVFIRDRAGESRYTNEGGP